MKELQDSFARLFVARDILTHFEAVNLEEDQGVMLIELIERGDAEHMLKSVLREGKTVKDGYMKTVQLQSFPAQGKEVFLRLKRRRRKIKGTKKGLYNNDNFINIGMKSTKEFGSSLKEIGRE
ncbi:MAG: hypothetical protein ACJATI_005507 [Halioglobus sp.]|jgi:hypothetical protein